MTVATNFLGVERQLITIEKCMESGLKYIYFAADFQKFSGDRQAPSPNPTPLGTSCLGSGLRPFITGEGGQLPLAMRGGS